MPYKIFIEGQHKDSDLARVLSRRLKEAGLEVLPYESIVKDTEFKINPKSGMLEADEVVFLITPNSLNSQRLIYDMGVASSLDKRVVPLLQGIEIKALPPIIKETSLIKFADLDRYISQVKRRADELAKSTATK